MGTLKADPGMSLKTAWGAGRLGAKWLELGLGGIWMGENMLVWDTQGPKA